MLEKKAIRSRVMFIDRKEKLLFTYSEVKKARERYKKELAKVLVENA